MSTETYGVTFQKVDGLRLKCTVYNTYGDWVGIPVGKDLFVRILSGGAIGEEMGDDLHEENRTFERMGEFIASVKVVATRNYPGILQNTFYYSDSADFSYLDSLPQIQFEIEVMDTRYLAHLEEGDHLASRAYSVGNRRSRVHDVDPYTCFEGIEEWGSTEAGVVRLVDWLSSASSFLAWRAAEELGGLGPAARDAVPALLLATQDTDADVRGYAVEALGRIGDPCAVDGLLPLLGHSKESVRVSSLVALAQLVPSCGRCDDALTRLAEGLPLCPVSDSGSVTGQQHSPEVAMLAHAALFRITSAAHHLTAWLDAIQDSDTAYYSQLASVGISKERAAQLEKKALPYL